MKKFTGIALLLVLVLSMQIVACAAETPVDSVLNGTAMTAAVQPRGAYLQGGGCTITPYSGYVTVGGHTDAFDDVDELKITLTILQEISPGCFVAIWSDTVTATDDFEVTYPLKAVYVARGYNYMLEATHTVTHNGVTESNYSETGSVYVY